LKQGAKDDKQYLAAMDDSIYGARERLIPQARGIRSPENQRNAENRKWRARLFRAVADAPNRGCAREFARDNQGMN